MAPVCPVAPIAPCIHVYVYEVTPSIVLLVLCQIYFPSSQVGVDVDHPDAGCIDGELLFAYSTTISDNVSLFKEYSSNIAAPSKCILLALIVIVSGDWLIADIMPSDDTFVAIKSACCIISDSAELSLVSSEES